MTLPENRKPEGLEKNEPVKLPDALVELTGIRRVQIISGGRMLVITTNGRTLRTRWENEE